MRTSAFTESGGAAALNGIRRYTKNQFSVAGIHIETPDVGPLSIRATMGWQRSFGHIDPVTAVRFGNDPAFQVAGAPLSRDAVLLETELGMKIGPDAWLRASYASQIGDQGQDHAIRANLTISF
jgi:outer membrane autotransporter protein